MNEDTIISIVIRIMPSGMEFDIDLPLYTTGKQLLDELMALDEVERVGQNGQPYSYRLISKGTGQEIDLGKSLYNIGIKEGDTVILAADLEAGASSY